MKWAGLLLAGLALMACKPIVEPAPVEDVGDTIVENSGGVCPEEWRTTCDPARE